MNSSELVFVGVEEGKKSSQEIADTANRLSIVDDDQYEEVGKFLQSIKAERKVWDIRCDKAIDAAHKEWKARLGFKAEFCKPLDAAEKITKDKMAAYSEMRKAERAAEQKRLDDIARKEAEKKRAEELAKIEAEAKIQREKDAAAKKIRDAEIAKLKKEGDEKALKQAQEQAVKDAAAKKIRDEEAKQRAAVAAAKPLEIQAVQLADEGPKAAGVSTTMVWTGEVIGGPNIGDLNPAIKEKNLRLLIQAIAKGDAPIYLVEECATEIRKMGDSTSGTVPVPGVRFYQKPKTSVRA